MSARRHSNDDCQQAHRHIFCNSDWPSTKLQTSTVPSIPVQPVRKGLVEVILRGARVQAQTSSPANQQLATVGLRLALQPEARTGSRKGGTHTRMSACR